MTEALVEWIKVHPEAKEPKKNFESDSGFDLYSIEDIVIQPGRRHLVDTGLLVNVGVGFEGQVRPTSGNAWKKGITVLNSPGTIDGAFTGNLKVILINLDQMPVTIYKGDKIAQFVVFPVIKVVSKVVDSFSRDNERGTLGWGSSGIVGKKDV